MSISFAVCFIPSGTRSFKDSLIFLPRDKSSATFKPVCMRFYTAAPRLCFRNCTPFPPKNPITRRKSPPSILRVSVHAGICFLRRRECRARVVSWIDHSTCHALFCNKMASPYVSFLQMTTMSQCTHFYNPSSSPTRLNWSTICDLPVEKGTGLPVSVMRFISIVSNDFFCRST